MQLFPFSKLSKVLVKNTRDFYTFDALAFQLHLTMAARIEDKAYETSVSTSFIHLFIGLLGDIQ